ncbi:vWA domain-containing protein [Vitiosangium sp. GDMCC 1.1324]|uniref:vWA domain-containing protein n=1 Tax=Vitiosangium sp. (strain GDMCC 1.1324) TaxID=2138576 RepID=UPI000D352C16|nr:vWA domain-containing protein [Vitiosangium sp. GDMCC 1.1324]PTL75881.1 VWA domain-containing protein [Vitiosangium sp. GDMCC 1.1324]
MLGSRLARLRLRLDALQGSPSQSEGLRGWWLGLTAPSEVDVSLPTVTALDRALDRVGVHTLADARLLLELGVKKGRVGELATGLKSRAAEALEEFEQALGAVEKMLRVGRSPPGARTALERGFVRLARVLRVAELFLSPTPPPAQEEGGFEIFEKPGPLWNARGAPSKARMAVAEFLAHRARDNVEDLVQKRRDLDMAHEILLRIGMEHDRDRGVALRNEVAQARDRVREQPATRSLDALVQEVRRTARRDPQMAWRSLRGLYERALEANDPQLAAAARAALEPMMPSREPMRALLESSERENLTRWFGEEPPAIEGPKGLRESPKASTADDLLADLAFSLRPEQLSAFELAAGCARYFDVEDSLTEEIVEVNTRKVRPVPRRVPYPTQNMTFERTGGLHDVNNFVISDPRLLVYDLAAHSQTVRAYLEDEPPPQPKKMKRTAVRVYVCDASGSMHGSRARFRDAIIIAELNNLRVKVRQGLPFDPLYFSFFNDTPTELARVDTAREATRQIEKLFRDSPAEGQTDITLALMSAFDSIRAARGRDPYLARATVVLITDGEDRVDLDLIRRTRAPMDALDIALSFISLGEENPDLKSLVQEQRGRGGRAFYHHLSDQEIQWAKTEFDSPWRTLLPHEVPVTPEVIDALTPHLQALEALAAGRAVSSPAPVISEASFDALFPEAERIGSQKMAGEVPGPEVIARVADILDAIVEASALASADRRATESLSLLQHLLGVYQLTPGRYLAALAAGGSEVHERLARVRLLCRPFE